MVERWWEGGKEGGREGTRMTGEKGEGQKRREIGRVVFWEGRKKGGRKTVGDGGGRREGDRKRGRQGCRNIIHC